MRWWTESHQKGLTPWKDQWEIRALLQEENAPIFVAAGLALPESLGSYEALLTNSVALH